MGKSIIGLLLSFIEPLRVYSSYKPRRDQILDTRIISLYENIMNNSTQSYDDQVDTVRIEDITTDIKNRNRLRRLKNNRYGTYVYGEENRYLWIENQHDNEEAERCVSYVPGGDYDMGWLGYFVGKSNLRELSIMNKSFLEPFLRGVNHNKSITDIGFYELDLLGGQSFRVLESFFKNNHNLTDITINNCRFGIGCSHSLASIIGGCSISLELLRMRYNNINEEEFVTVITSLSMHPQLKTLELGGNVICKKGCMALATLLQHSTTWLQNLDLSQNGINDIGIEVLVPALAKHRHLQKLVIFSNDSITTRGWQSLATILEDPNSNLNSLIMHADNIDDETASVFRNALSSNCSLQGLHMGAKNINEDIQQSFSNLLCDTSSVNATYLSNHTLIKSDRMLEQDSKPLLKLNRNDDKKEVATIKILKHHEDFDMKPFFEWEFKVLPLVISWLERASAYTTDFDANIEGRKLSSIYQFVRDMPVLYVETRLRKELEDMKLEESQMEEEENRLMLQREDLLRRRQLLQERKKSITEKLGVGKQQA